MVTISSVEKGSPADSLGILPGDVLVSIDSHPIGDVLDYRFFLTEPRITLTLRRGEKEWDAVLKKGRYDDIGLDFETFLMDEKRRCSNGCIFCFIDQNPKGMRETVYFKDDDTRLSFLMGNYVTLTNVTDEELDRIIKMKMNPVNVSVHTTNPLLRETMLRNKKAGRIMEQLKRLRDGGISIHCQIVVCPGYNDGAELEKTVSDLSALFPELSSIAVVPVGLTRHREGLCDLAPFTKEGARALLKTVETMGDAFLEQFGTRLVFPADEFYLTAEMPIPESDFYEDYSQLDNGVGLLRNSEEEILEEIRFQKENRAFDSLPQTAREITLATGFAAKDFLERICKELSLCLPFIRFRVLPVPNRFFGETVTVSGLICGGDLIEEAKKYKTEVLLFPAVALRHERDLFLDGVSVKDVEQALSCPVFPVENGVCMIDEILKILRGGEKEWQSRSSQS